MLFGIVITALFAVFPGLIVIIVLFAIFLGLIALLLSAFWIWMLVVCALNKQLKETPKILWILLIVFTHVLGAAIYFFAEYLPGRRQPQFAYVAQGPGRQPNHPYAQGYQMQQERPPYQEGEQQRSSEPSQYEPYERPQAHYPEQIQEQ